MRAVDIIAEAESAGMVYVAATMSEADEGEFMLELSKLTNVRWELRVTPKKKLLIANNVKITFTPKLPKGRWILLFRKRV